MAGWVGATSQSSTQGSGNGQIGCVAPVWCCESYFTGVSEEKNGRERVEGGERGRNQIVWCRKDHKTRTWLNTSVSEAREGQLQSIHKQLCNDHYNLHLPEPAHSII